MFENLAGVTYCCIWCFFCVYYEYFVRSTCIIYLFIRYSMSIYHALQQYTQQHVTREVHTPIHRVVCLVSFLSFSHPDIKTTLRSSIRAHIAVLYPRLCSWRSGFLLCGVLLSGNFWPPPSCVVGCLTCSIFSTATAVNVYLCDLVASALTGFTLLWPMAAKPGNNLAWANDAARRRGSMVGRARHASRPPFSHYPHKSTRYYHHHQCVYSDGV